MSDVIDTGFVDFCREVDTKLANTTDDTVSVPFWTGDIESLPDDWAQAFSCGLVAIRRDRWDDPVQKRRAWEIYSDQVTMANLKKTGPEWDKFNATGLGPDQILKNLDKNGWLFKERTPSVVIHGTMPETFGAAAKRINDAIAKAAEEYTPPPPPTSGRYWVQNETHNNENPRLGNIIDFATKEVVRANVCQFDYPDEGLNTTPPHPAPEGYKWGHDEKLPWVGELVPVVPNPKPLGCRWTPDKDNPDNGRLTNMASGVHFHVNRDDLPPGTVINAAADQAYPAEYDTGNPVG